ncbi:MAG: hypothetical protein AVO35_11300 [Candidatus Aegiribacteria sp. MLS_C]|nr:MAG: hypothetical protein AVO35_11300 [Candidatus Aegiribacteria sp. MLS_C]
MQDDIRFDCNDADSPVKAFNTGGALTDCIRNTVIPAARGLAFESDQFMRVSNMYEDRIYRINLNPTGTAEGGCGTSVSLCSDINPFSSVVTVTGTGLTPDAFLEVYDMAGRAVISAPFCGSFTWAATSSAGKPVPAGAYIAVVRDGESFESLRIVRL